MTRRDRVVEALRHRESDQIPFHADFTQQEYEKLSHATRETVNGSVHLHCTQYWGWPTELADRPERFRDDFGVVWNRSGADKDIGVMENPAIDEPDIRLWREPVLDEARLRAEYEELLRTKEDKFVLAGIGFSVFERAWSLCGMENVLVYMISEPAFIDELLASISE